MGAVLGNVKVAVIWELDEPVTDAVMTPEGLMVICGVEAATVNDPERVT